MMALVGELEKSDYQGPETPKQIKEDILQMLTDSRFLRGNPFANPEIGLAIDTLGQVEEAGENFFQYMDPLFNPQLPYFNFLKESFNGIEGYYQKVKDYWNSNIINFLGDKNDLKNLLNEFIPKVQEFIAYLVKELKANSFETNGEGGVVDAARSGVKGILAA